MLLEYGSLLKDREYCPDCGYPMKEEHSHYRCPRCFYRDTCCEGAPLPDESGYDIVQLYKT